jgi:hypothetical protein
MQLQSNLGTGALIVRDWSRKICDWDRWVGRKSRRAEDVFIYGYCAPDLSRADPKVLSQPDFSASSRA